MAGRGPGSAGPSKAQQDQWNEKAMQLMKRHDMNGDGLLDPREMASAINELCGTHGFSARSITAALGLESKLDNSSYRWSPVEFCEMYRRAMLMADSGEAAGGGAGGARGLDRLMGQAVDTLRDLDAKSEASLKQCYNNYCRLTVPGAGKMMMEGDLKLSSAHWHQLCADVGLAQPIGPISPTDLANIFNTASQRTSGLTLKQFLTGLAMISPDLTTLCNHMVAQLGPQMKPRAGSDAPQPACFPLRNLDLKSAAAQSHWGAAQNVISAANAFMKGGGGGAGGLSNGGGGAGGGGGLTAALGIGSTNSSFTAALNGGGGGVFSVEIEETLSRTRFGSPVSSRPGGPPEQLAPIVGGPITAKLGGGGIKRSSLTSLGGGARGSSGNTSGAKSLDMPSSQMVLLDRLAAAEARITQLEQQQSFAKEMMAAAAQGGYGAGGRGAATASGGSSEGVSVPQVAALEAKIAALEAELARVAPGADAPRQVREVRDSLDLLTERLESLTKTLERATKRIDSAEATARAAEEQVRALQAPVTETNASLASLREATEQLKAGLTSKESELMQQLVTRISGTEGQLEALEGQLRKLVREGKLAAALPSKEALTAAMAAAAPDGAAAAGAPPAPSTPTTGGGGSVPVVPTPPPGPKPSPKSMGSNGGGAGGGNGGNGDYFVQALGVVQLDTEEDIRLQIKLLTEAIDNMKRRLSQIAGSTTLNPIDFPTRNELSEVKKVIMGDIADIDAKYIKVQKEVSTLSLKMPALEKKVESSALGSGTEVVNRLVSMGMARLVDVKETENYLVDRGAGTTKQFENLRRDMQDVQGDLQANMEKLVTQFNSINRQLMEAKREAAAPAVATIAAAVGAGGGGGSAASAATAATAASAAATAAQSASEARSAVDRERADRERETRELRERLARAESHLGGALGELQTVVGAELTSIKEVLTQLEAAMNQADGDAMRLIRELDVSLRSALGSLERASTDQNEMTGKVIMKMARQITEMQVKLREMATMVAAAASQAAPPSPALHSPLSSPSALQMQQLQQQQARESDAALPFAARLLAQQAGGSGGGTNSGDVMLNAPSSPSMAGRREYLAGAGPRTSMSGGGPGGGGRGSMPVGASEGGGGRNVAVSPARGMLAADPPPAPPSRVGGPRLSETGLAVRVSSNGR
ncbi:hypothetical protein Vafri_15341 [Volvox africanus]|uniref:EF-hand domain-containing protein n=1 Tax=Volvox africanus TaxID=51714 RepID=A0A8J4BHH8_9CHLO|nr:hypothetical protein Vafri_15341 [Volvox africanus]